MFDIKCCQWGFLSPWFLVGYRLFVNWRFMRGIEAQFLALQKGFNELIPQHLLRPFDEKELEVTGRRGDSQPLHCASLYSQSLL